MKRLFDLFVVLALAPFWLPLLIVIAIFVRIALGSPVFFRQVRPGYQGAPFTLIKFRTMTDARDKDGNLLSDAERLKPLGKLLRASSLDELPELFNVLKGEMSLVGPRPLLMQYLPLYSPEQARRHDAKPGITGWAQINGRNAISWADKFNLDVWYVDHQSLLLDAKILFLTFWKVVSREGITQPGSATTQYFTGNDETTSGKQVEA